MKISGYFLRLKPFSIALRYIFPGLALGAALGQSGVVTNAMINRSAEALVELISEEVPPLCQQYFVYYFFTKLFLINTGSGSTGNLPGRLRHQGDFGAHRCPSNRAGDIGGSEGKKNTNLSTGFDTQHPWINFNVTQVENEDALEALQDGGEEGLKAYVVSKMWAPEYRPLVYLPPGKGE